MRAVTPFLLLRATTRRSARIVIAVLATAACTSQVAAQKFAEVTERDYLAPVPIVLSASRLAQPLTEAPAAVTVIEGDTIRMLVARNLAEVLALVPGFLPARVRGNLPSVAYHFGADALERRFQVMVDGRSVYNPGIGRIEWTMPVALEDIARVEVVRGTNSVTLGSNALLASINVITKRASEARSGVLAEAGNRDLARVLGRYSFASNDVGLRVTGSHARDQGLLDVPDDQRDRFANVRLDWRLTGNDSLMLSAGGQQRRFENRDPEPVSANNPIRIDHDWTEYVQARWDHVMSADLDWTLSASRSVYRLRDQYVITGVPGIARLPVDLDYQTTRDDVEGSLSLRASDTLRSVVGAQFRREQSESSRYFHPPQQTLDIARLFATLEWRATPAATLHGGLMLEHHGYAGTLTAPRFAMNYALGAESSLRASVTRGFRGPTQYDEKAQQRYLFGDRLLTVRVYQRGGLRAERIDSSEVGWWGRATGGALEFDVRLAHDRLHDFMAFSRQTLPPDVRPLLGPNSAFTTENRIRGRVLSADLAATWRPTRDTQITASYSGAHAELTIPGANEESVRSFERSAPRRVMKLHADRDFGDGWRARLGVVSAASVDWSGTGQAPAPAYTIIDAAAARRWACFGTRCEVFLKVNGLGGAYQDFSSEVTVPRQVWLGVAVGL